MTTCIPVVKAGTGKAARLIQKLSQRLAALEQLDSAEYRDRVKKIFGLVLRPEEVVARILSDVRRDGDAALFDYARKIDGVALTPKTIRVSDSERRAGYRRTAPATREALELAAERIADYQSRLMPSSVPARAAKGGPAGVRTGLNWSPLNRAGLCCPGATAAYPSSVLMIAIPAIVAGVKELAMVTPCNRNLEINDAILCACEIAKIGEIYRVGGAQAVAALAYGTKSIAPVDKIVGPGNLFVMLAKRAVFGQVDIDMLAGPSEVLVIADSSADAEYVAADLLAQAEHDKLCSCVLLTDSDRLAKAVERELAAQLEDLPRRSIAAAALRDWGLIAVTRNIEQAVELANTLAPEHLEIMTRSPRKWIPKIRAAGAIFVGPYATEPLGDYVAGPSHTLPTGATARAFSGLSVFSFLKRTSIIEADAAGLDALSEPISVLAAAEGLEAHRRAVVRRRKP
jgi:histidinol dehydrogenase